VKSPRFARRLLAAGARGVCVAKPSEAEVMAADGIEDILITTEVAGVPMLERVIALLRRHPQIKLVDGVEGASALAAALAEARLCAEVLIELDVGLRRCGVLPGEPALELAARLRGWPALRSVGVQGYEGHLQLLADAGARERQCGEAVVDAGLKSLSTDSGFAEPKDLPRVAYRPVGDEHGVLSWSAGDAAEDQRKLRVGDRVELIPSHIDTTINLHDRYHVMVGAGVLETWSVDARGKVQ
jgi:D-serine deaminase-like pyridoxal phosphate-dependent protein